MLSVEANSAHSESLAVIGWLPVDQFMTANRIACKLSQHKMVSLSSVDSQAMCGFISALIFTLFSVIKTSSPCLK